MLGVVVHMVVEDPVRAQGLEHAGAVDQDHRGVPRRDVAIGLAECLGTRMGISSHSLA